MRALLWTVAAVCLLWALAGTPRDARQAGDAVAGATQKVAGLYGSDASSSAKPSAGRSPLRDPRGRRRGLNPVPRGQYARARKLIRAVPAATIGAGGYERVAFGNRWTDNVNVTFGHNGCNTRDDILRRDLTHDQLADECDVTGGVLDDPYTGRTIRFSKSDSRAVQIDHVIALSYAWSQGAGAWAQSIRERLANDPVNLIAVDGAANQSKGDQGPSQWLPPNTQAGLHCAYSVRFAQTARRYELTVRPADKRTMLKTCGAS